jgi:hypothetical protein
MQSELVQGLFRGEVSVWVEWSVRLERWHCRCGIFIGWETGRDGLWPDLSIMMCCGRDIEALREAHGEDWDNGADWRARAIFLGQEMRNVEYSPLIWYAGYAGSLVFLVPTPNRFALRNSR